MLTAVVGQDREVEPVSVEAARLPAWKRTMDVTVSALLLIAVAPLCAIIALAVALESPGGVFYRHRRVGQGGKPFTCWKFRSMRVGADREQEQLRAQNEASGHIFKIKADPRCTRTGRLLRKTSLDELPQLWNVLRGDMSLVGPRPPLPSEVEHYSERDRERLRGVPGITGLWQVKARERHDFDEMVELDIRYLAELSWRMDAWILMLTVPVVLFARGSY